MCKERSWQCKTANGNTYTVTEGGSLHTETDGVFPEWSAFDRTGMTGEHDLWKRERHLGNVPVLGKALFGYSFRGTWNLSSRIVSIEEVPYGELRLEELS